MVIVIIINNIFLVLKNFIKIIKVLLFFNKKILFQTLLIYYILNKIKFI